METKSGPERGAWSRRPSFTPRQILTADLLNAGLDDELKRQRLLARAVHGFGVVLGFGVSVRDDGTLDLDRGCLELTEGLALDRHGRMLLWTGGRIGIRDLVGPPPQRPGRYTLCAHFSARPPLVDDCTPSSGDRARWQEEGVVFSIRQRCDDVDCGCPTHSDDCVTHEEYLARRTGGLLGDSAIPPSPDVAWLLRAPGEQRPTGDDGWTYDPDPEACVPIACLEICDLVHSGHDDAAQAARHEHDCDPRYGFCPGSRPETSRVRPLVHRNPLLYELASCCDVELARVESISWQAWIDAGWSTLVSWSAFADRIASRTEGFEVWFTKPLDPATVHGASIVMTAWYQDDDASWRSYRVPLASVDPLERDGHVRGARLVAEEEWLRSEVRGRLSNLFGGARIEVTIRGQLLRDLCGQMLDARPIGLTCGVRCQARPGGDLVSTFQVHARPRNRAAGRTGHQDGPQQGADET